MNCIKSLKIIIFACLFFPNINFAQDVPSDIQYIDIVHLKDGSEFRGKIIEYKHGEYLKMEILGGQIVEFPAKQIKKTVQQPYGDSAYVPKVVKTREYRFRESGIYNETSVQFPNGLNSWSTWISGIGVHHVVGYQYNRWIGGGIGLGFETFYPGYGEVIVPLYAEARGYLMKKNVTPFYSVSLGYGFAPNIDVSEVNRIGGRGGLLFNPNLGYRFGASDGSNFTLSLGYRLQKASFTEENWEGTFKRNYTYNRVNLKLGLLF